MNMECFYKFSIFQKHWLKIQIASMVKCAYTEWDEQDTLRKSPDGNVPEEKKGKHETSPSVTYFKQFSFPQPAYVSLYQKEHRMDQWPVLIWGHPFQDMFKDWLQAAVEMKTTFLPYKHIWV